MTRSGRRFARKTGWSASTVRLEATPVPLWSGGRRRARYVSGGPGRGLVRTRGWPARGDWCSARCAGEVHRSWTQGHPAPAPGQQPREPSMVDGTFTARPCPRPGHGQLRGSGRGPGRAHLPGTPSNHGRLAPAQKTAGTRPLRAPGLPGPGPDATRNGSAGHTSAVGGRSARVDVEVVEGGKPMCQPARTMRAAHLGDAGGQRRQPRAPDILPA